MKNVDDKSEDETDQKERIQYLRERGIEIEFPEDRRNKGPSPKVKSFDEKFQKIISIVRIPVNTNESYEEMNVIVDKEPSDRDSLPEVLKDNFTKNVDDSLIKTLMKDMGAGAGISKETLLRLALEGQAEAFSIARPCDANKWTAVNFYVDELGQSKRLELNTRASSLANFCGFRSVPILGDVYVGRYELVPKGSGGQGYNTLDFKMNELDSSAPWAKRCERDNYELGIQTGQVSMDGNNNINESGNSGKATIIPLNGDTSGVNSGQRFEVDANEAVEFTDDDKIPGCGWSECEESIDVTINLLTIIKDKIINGTNLSTVDDIKINKKMLQVSILRDAITVVVKGIEGCIDTDGAQGRASLKIPLAGIISPDDSTWTLAGNTVELSLEKVTSDTVIWNRLKRLEI